MDVMSHTPGEEPMDTENAEDQQRSQESMDVDQAGQPPNQPYDHGAHAPPPDQGSPAAHDVVTSQPIGVSASLLDQDLYRSPTETQKLPAEDPSTPVSGTPDAGPGAPQPDRAELPTQHMYGSLSRTLNYSPAETPTQSNNTSAFTHPNLQDKQGTGDDHSPEASAPQDVGKIYITLNSKIDLPTKSKKWKSHLEKALQSMVHKIHQKEEKWTIVNVELMDGETSAEVKIMPTSAVQELLKLGHADLQFKDLDLKVNVQFSQDEPESQKPKTTKQESVPPGNVDTHHQMDTANFMSTAITSKSDLKIPLFQFWYLIQAYTPELDQLQKKLGVEMKAEVSVSFTTNQNLVREDSVKQAEQMFSDLYVKATNNIRSIPVPQSQQGRGLNELLRDLPDKDQRKCVMCTSPYNSVLMAPEPTATRIKKLLDSETSAPGGGTSASMDRSASRNSMLTNKTIEFDIKDAPASLDMAETHWNLVQKIYGQQISEIENKYDVKFRHEPLRGYVKVTARSNGTYKCLLETHAIRALTHLYQKVAASTIACSFKDPSDVMMTPDALETILSKYSVIIVKHDGTERLTGLVQGVVHAMDDVEKLLGRHVFDDKIKKALGSPNDYLLPERGGDEASGVNHKLSGANGDAHQNEKKKEEEDEKCPICLDSFTDKTKLKCGHGFCKDCLVNSVRSMGKICPLCKAVFGILTGNQPPGTMIVRHCRSDLPGYSNCGTIEIIYNIPSGIQTPEHPNPGRPYHGTTRTAYLPDNAEGNQVLSLLRRAFDQRLIFTVGTSRTSGQDDAVIWNDVHHKTSKYGGPPSFGYPDPEYLSRVKDELKDKGIV